MNEELKIDEVDWFEGYDVLAMDSKEFEEWKKEKEKKEILKIVGSKKALVVEDYDHDEILYPFAIMTNIVKFNGAGLGVFSVDELLEKKPTIADEYESLMSLFSTISRMYFKNADFVFKKYKKEISELLKDWNPSENKKPNKEKVVEDAVVEEVKDEKVPETKKEESTKKEDSPKKENKESTSTKVNEKVPETKKKDAPKKEDSKENKSPSKKENVKVPKKENKESTSTKVNEKVPGTKKEKESKQPSTKQESLDLESKPLVKFKNDILPDIKDIKNDLCVDFIVGDPDEYVMDLNNFVCDSVDEFEKMIEIIFILGRKETFESGTFEGDPMIPSLLKGVIVPMKKGDKDYIKDKELMTILNSYSATSNDLNDVEERYNTLKSICEKEFGYTTSFSGFFSAIIDKKSNVFFKLVAHMGAAFNNGEIAKKLTTKDFK